MSGVVSTTEITAVYQSLMGSAKNTLTEQFNNGYLKGADYAAVLGNVLTGAMQLSVSTATDQPLKTAQVLDMKVKDFILLAESEMKRKINEAKIELMTAQIATEQAKRDAMESENLRIVKDNTSDMSLKSSQIALIGKQKLTEAEKALLTTRQTAWYSDQKMIKRAEIMGQVVGMYGAGGIPSGEMSESFTGQLGLI